MKFRSVIAIVWISAFFIAVCVLEGYFVFHNSMGIPYLIPEERIQIYPLFVGIYSLTLGPLLLAFFLRPFNPPRQKNRIFLIKPIAMGLTIFYNVAILYLISRAYFSSNISINDIISQTKQAALILEFLVVPVNVYYFGMKAVDGAE